VIELPIEFLPTLYRVPMRSRKYGVDHEKQVEWALEHGIVAIGWGRGDEIPGTLEDCLRGIEKHWDRRSASCVARFAEAENGSLVWSLHTDGTWLLGEIVGEWKPDYSPGAAAVDMYQTRKIRWAPRRLLSEEVPGGAIRAFSGRGSAFSEIKDIPARLLSSALFAELNGEEPELPNLSASTVLTSLLSPFDVEDLVFAFLQVECDYLVIPGTRRTDNAAYEYAVVRRGTSELQPVSIKTGNTPVNTAQLASTAGVAKTRGIAYSTTGHYDGPTDGVVEVIKDADLLRFAEEKAQYLPPRVRRWFKYSRIG
jgi:hypothetical protein